MSISTFKNIQDKVLRWIDEAEDTSTTQAIVQDAINASHKRILNASQWPFMSWPQAQQITTTSGVGIYSLNPNCNRVYHLWDVTLCKYVPVVPRREWPAIGVNRSNTDIPPYGVTFGPTWPVATQPASADLLGLVSSSSSDGSTVTVMLRGVNGSGVYIEETVTMTGTTPVATTNSFAQLIGITKTGTWVGTLTIVDGDTNTLLTLSASEAGRQYSTVEFLELPEAGRVLTYNFQRQPLTLSQDGDIPEIPSDYVEILVYDTLLDLTTYNTELGVKEQAHWTRRYDTLMNAMQDAYNEQIVGSYPKFIRDLDDRGRNRVSVYNP